MVSTLENKVARYRKLREMVAELEDCLKPLKEEAETLQDEIFAEFSRKPSLYNVCRKKTVSMGFVGKNLVRVDFGKAFERADGGRRDDQEWLKKLVASPLGGNYVKTRYELNLQKLLGDFKSEILAAESAKMLGLNMGTTYKLKVYRIPRDAEFSALKEEALKLADETDEQ